MVTARARYLIERLEQKFGVIGKVAGRYIAAGLSVELMHPTRYGPIHIIARGDKGKILAIEVVEEANKVTVDQVKTFLEKAKLIKAKPILAIYSSNFKLPDDVYKFCKENGIKIKVVRPGEPIT
jgi:RecB family endonuclease NucS